MGGSGGGYSGGGYSGGGSGGGGTKSGGSGGSGGSDPCTVNTNATLASPNPAVVGTLAVGHILNVTLNTSGASPIVQVVAPGGVAGTLAGMPRLRDLIDCITGGSTYEFEVALISGGRVEGRLRNS
jgi:hypothetical protein